MLHGSNVCSYFDCFVRACLLHWCAQEFFRLPRRFQEIRPHQLWLRLKWLRLVPPSSVCWGPMKTAWISWFWTFLNLFSGLYVLGYGWRMSQDWNLHFVLGSHYFVMCTLAEIAVWLASCLWWHRSCVTSPHHPSCMPCLSKILVPVICAYTVQICTNWSGNTWTKFVQRITAAAWVHSLCVFLP